MSALSYNECEIDRSAVASARESFAELHSLIIGRSGEYNTITSHVGFEFTDMIGEGLRSAANENEYAWSSSMMACVHGYGVLDKISTDVKWYEDKIEEIKERLSTALGNMSDPEDLTAANSIVEAHDLEAQEAWQDLETRCDESQDMLKEGPTPENIRALADAGYFGNNENIGFYTTGDFDYYHVDEGQAGVIATHIGHAVLDGNEVSIELLEDNPEYLALVSAVVSRGLLAQQNGDKLLDGEVEFLETLFGDLGGISGDDSGFLDFVDQVNGSEHISDSLRQDINRNLSNSMLILSDERIGGGVDQLPQDVRDVLQVPDFPSVNSLHHDSELPGFMRAYSDWGEPFTTLSDFLDTSGPGVEGGTEFSTALMGTVAATLDVPYFAAGEPGDEQFQNVLGVASRNEEANHIILTGEDFEGEAYEHYESHGDLTPESILETFYTHDWSDDGEAVGGITDWIARYHEHGSPEEQEHAGEAAHALIEILTGEGEDGNPFRDTDDEGDGDYPLAVTEINPELAASLGSVYISYLDDFSIATDENGYRQVDGNRDDLYLFHENGDNALLLPQETKEEFLQLLVANEDLAPNIIAATESQERRIIEAFLTHPNVADNVGGQNAADLRTMLDNALIQEYVDRNQSIEEARTSANNQWQTGYNVFTAVATGLGGARSTPVGIGTEVLIKIMEQPLKDYVGDLVEENIDFEYIDDLDQRFMTSPAEIRDHANLQMLDVMVSMDLIDMDTLEEEGLLIEEEDGTMRLPATTADWSTGSSGYMSAVEDVIANTSFENDHRVDAYVRGFMELYGPDLYRNRMEDD